MSPPPEKNPFFHSDLNFCESCFESVVDCCDFSIRYSLLWHKSAGDGRDDSACRVNLTKWVQALEPVMEAEMGSFQCSDLCSGSLMQELRLAHPHMCTDTPYKIVTINSKSFKLLVMHKILVIQAAGPIPPSTSDGSTLLVWADGNDFRWQPSHNISVS